MNPWVKKSMERANAYGYLDELHEVYPVDSQIERELPKDILARLQDAHKSRDEEAFLRLLMGLDKFPIDDPYVAFLKKGDAFIKNNPKTVRRITSQLFAMPFEAVMHGIRKPKSASRRMGAAFQAWLAKNFDVLPSGPFEKNKETSFLRGSGKELKSYANEHLGFSLTKEPDFIGKTKHGYLLGEAKFLTDHGGGQNEQLEDALSLASKKGKATAVAVLDGVVWIESGNKMHVMVVNFDGVAISALLLKEFLTHPKTKN